MLKTLLINTSSNLLLLIIKLIITFIMTPVFIHNLGKYDYGLWEMIGGVIGYMGMLDLGIRPAISRYAAKYQALNDKNNLDAVFSSTLIFMILVGAILLVFFSCWGLWFSASLSEDGASDQKYTLLMLILAGQLMVSFPGYVAESYLEGFQKYYVKNNITIINSIVGGVILYTFISPENGLLLLALVNAIGVSIKFILYFFLLSRSSLGKIYFRYKYFSYSKLLEVIKFGFKSFVQGISTRIEMASDALIIGIFLGPASVPFYSIPANLVQYLRTLGWTLTHAFMPLFAGLDANSESGKIKDVYLLASKYVSGIVFALAAGVAVIGGPFIGIWIGEEFQEKGEIVIYMLIFFTVLPFSGPFMSRYLTAIGRHGIFARLGPVAAIINIGLSLALVEKYGIEGVAFASMVPVVIFVPVYLRYTCRQLGISLYEYFVKSIFPCVVPTCLAAVIAAALRIEMGIKSYTEIFIVVFIVGICWFVSFWLFAMGSNEKNYIIKRVSKFKNTYIN